MIFPIISIGTMLIASGRSRRPPATLGWGGPHSPWHGSVLQLRPIRWHCDGAKDVEELSDHSQPTQSCNGSSTSHKEPIFARGKASNSCRVPTSDSSHHNAPPILQNYLNNCFRWIPERPNRCQRNVKMFFRDLLEMVLD